MHTRLKIVLKSTSSDIGSESKPSFSSSKWVRFSKQMSNVNILAPVRENPSKCSLRSRPESQLWRRHPNLFLPANQEELTPKRFYHSGFFSELQRFFWHIMNTLTLVCMNCSKCWFKNSSAGIAPHLRLSLKNPEARSKSSWHLYFFKYKIFPEARSTNFCHLSFFQMQESPMRLSLKITSTCLIFSAGFASCRLSLRSDSCT